MKTKKKTESKTKKLSNQKIKELNQKREALKDLQTKMWIKFAPLFFDQPDFSQEFTDLTIYPYFELDQAINNFIREAEDKTELFNYRLKEFKKKSFEILYPESVKHSWLD